MRKLLIMGALSGFCAFQPAIAEDPQRADPTNKRLRALESKTDYYFKRSRNITRTWTRSRTRAGTTCEPQNAVTMTFDPQMQVGGLSYAWLNATVRYQGSPDQLDVIVIGGENPSTCGADIPLTGGTVTVRKFCFFPLDAGATYRVLFRAGVDNPCETFIEITADLKVTNTEIPEPE